VRRWISTTCCIRDAPSVLVKCPLLAGSRNWRQSAFGQERTIGMAVISARKRPFACRYCVRKCLGSCDPGSFTSKPSIGRPRGPLHRCLGGENSATIRRVLRAKKRLSDGKPECARHAHLLGKSRAVCPSFRDNRAKLHSGYSRPG